MYQSQSQPQNGYAYGDGNQSLSPTNGSQAYTPTASPTTPQPVSVLRAVDLLDTGKMALSIFTSRGGGIFYCYFGWHFNLREKIKQVKLKQNEKVKVKTKPFYKHTYANLKVTYLFFYSLILITHKLIIYKKVKTAFSTIRSSDGFNLKSFRFYSCFKGVDKF